MPSPREARWRLSGLVRCPSFRAECLRPTTSLQRRLSGGVETDLEGFIRPNYNATGGASKAMRRGNFHRWDTNETRAVRLNRKTLKHQISNRRLDPAL
jgi:hypothetical protein